MSYISTILKELTDKNLITCLNPQKRQGRFYTTIDKGKRGFKIYRINI